MYKLKQITRGPDANLYKQYDVKAFRHEIEKISRDENRVVLSCVKSDNQTIETITNKQMMNYFEKLEGELQRSGISERNIACLLLPPGNIMAIVCRALARSNMVAAPIDISLPIEEQKRLIENIIKPDCIISLSPVAITGSRKFLLDTEYCLSEYDPQDSYVQPSRVDDDIVCLICSSGTTGNLKVVEITYCSVILGNYFKNCYLDVIQEDTFFIPLPFTHVTGFNVNLFGLICDVPLLLVENLNTQSLQTAFSKCNPDMVLLIPKVYDVMKLKIESILHKLPISIKKLYEMEVNKNLAERKSGHVPTALSPGLVTDFIRKKAFGKNMRLLAGGAAPYKENTALFFLGLGLSYINVYGITEAGFPVACSKYSNPLPLVGYDLLDSMDNIELKLDESTSEILVKSPLLMRGYLNDTESTAACFTNDGFFHTGDVGKINEQNHLEIVGRIKDIIQMGNGKKVSPDDVETFYEDVAQGLPIACCGVQKNDKEEIWLFVEGSGEAAQDAKLKITEKSISHGGLYRLDRIEIINDIPKTKIGKAKRYLLKDIASDILNSHEHLQQEASENTRVKGSDHSEHGRLMDILDSVTDTLYEFSPEMTLRDDVGIDSLALMTLVTSIEGEFGIDITENLDANMSVADLEELVTSKHGKKTTKLDVSAFPKHRSVVDNIMFSQFSDILQKQIVFQVIGYNNLQPDENYVLCPNHTSLFDPCAVEMALDRKRQTSCAAIAADYLWEKGFPTTYALKLMGYIPMSRTGNYLPSFAACSKILGNGGDVIIFPEGTRTKTGELLEFMDGASKLAQENNVRIIPVCLVGVSDLYPPYIETFQTTTPDGNPVSVYVSFGNPIETAGREPKEVTEDIKKFIANEKARLLGVK